MKYHWVPWSAIYRYTCRYCRSAASARTEILRIRDLSQRVFKFQRRMRAWQLDSYLRAAWDCKDSGWNSQKRKTHRKNMIDSEQNRFPSESSCIDHVNALHIILKQCPEFRFWLHLSLIANQGTMPTRWWTLMSVMYQNLPYKHWMHNFFLKFS